MEPNIIAIDPYIIGFVKNNWVTISLFIGFLKGLAVIIPGTTDDKVVTLIANLFSTIKVKKNNNSGSGQ